MVSLKSSLNNFIPYSWEASSEEIARKYGLKAEQIVRMDLNTSPYKPSGWLRSLAAKLPDVAVNLYPDTSYRRFREKVSNYTGLSADMVLVGNGGDECIMIVCQAFLEKGRNTVISIPTYSYFRIAAEINSAEARLVKRRPDGSDDVEKILEAVDKNTGAIFLCSPNNPTGVTTPIQDIRRIASEASCPVIVDEAYYEYSGKTATSLLSSYPNIIVIRTLSKAFSLAGARVGYALAAEETINMLNKVRPPNSLSIISLALAELAMSRVDQVRKWVKATVAERGRLASAIRKIPGVIVKESEANFLLLTFKTQGAGKIHEKLMEKGFVTRHLGNTIPNTLRVTVATAKTNKKFVETLRSIVD
ncbi:MAG: histidinol-phosphate transaminase [Aigarchaeota archaeon]|jgi:histidinol-phosphate aminotransferase|nr:histidinol-phosphate transaminase [Candidatus Caldarchaeales archaeon]MDJ0273092.1 histidinol-phosphate transaminase [Candidatus Caldarchaeales archaeon]